MLGTLIKPDVESLIRNRDWKTLREVFSTLEPPDLAEILEDFSLKDSVLAFRLIPRAQAALVFEYLPVDQQTKLVQSLADEQLVSLLNSMAPDDRTRLFEELPPEVTKRALEILTPQELKIARQLLGYNEDSAGRFMTPRYIALRPGMNVTQALEYLRQHSTDGETLNVLYIVDDKGQLVSELRLSTLVLASPEAMVGTLEDRPLVSLLATANREEIIASFEKYDRVAIPVTDSQNHMLGIITIDDVLDVAEEEATEDIQKLGGMEALNAPYSQTTFLDLLKKRGGWLAVLFVSEMLTTTVMTHFEAEIKKAVVVALFIPLIMSSGGNSGSQAASLIIRALATREITLSQWFWALRRELLSGLILGLGLGAIGFIRIILWHHLHITDYGPYYLLVGLTISITLVGVVLFGTICGSMFPFLLKRLKLDPATASAPFVATLVDVTGILIYFSVIILILKITGIAHF